MLQYIIPHKQLSLADVFSNCQDIYESDKPEFLSLLQLNIIQRIFSIPTDSLLLVFLKYSRHLREFCGFTKVPDASKITRFKQDFLVGLQLIFENLVDVTEPICQAIDSSKADMTIFDSSGMEAWVTENNPKFANRPIIPKFRILFIKILLAEFLSCFESKLRTRFAIT